MVLTVSAISSVSAMLGMAEGLEPSVSIASIVVASVTVAVIRMACVVVTQVVVRHC
jgi:hypothetical protein